MSDNIGEALKKILSEVADTAGLLWQKGWSEADVSCISVNLRDIPLSSLPQDYQTFFISLPCELPQLAGQHFFISASGRRMRDLARQPLKNALIIKITADGSGYNIISHNGKTDMRPATGLFSHLVMHNLMVNKKSTDRVIIETHPAELIALARINGAPGTSLPLQLLKDNYQPAASRITKGIGIVNSYASEEEELYQTMLENDVVLVDKYGVFSTGANPADAFDKIDIVAKAASVYFLSRR